MGDIILPPAVGLLTFERYADVTVLAGAYYTPTVSGLYHMATDATGIQYNVFLPEYYSDKDAAWRLARTYDYSARPAYGNAIGDGTNVRFYNGAATTYTLIVMRMGYTKPNPAPPIGRQTLYGKSCIVLESDEKGFIWIEEEDLTKLCEDVFLDVKEAKEKGEPHPLIGKTMIAAIKADTEDKMGYGKHKPLLRKLGYDV